MTEDKEMSKAMRQMLEQSGRVGAARGEAACDPISDEACGPLLEHQGTGSAKPTTGTAGLLQAVLTRENLQAAWRRVKATDCATCRADSAAMTCCVPRSSIGTAGSGPC